MVLDFIEILKVIFLGIVEGITEWLPISSTGHMILVDEFITLNMSEAFKEMFFGTRCFPFNLRTKHSQLLKRILSRCGSRLR